MTTYRTCTLCEAMCGLAIEVENGRIMKIRGDEEDPFSRGHICPKALALKNIHEDGNRIRKPLIKRNGKFVETDWHEALETTAKKIADLQAKYGNQAMAIYAGNPNVHNLGSMLYLPNFSKLLRTPNRYSASSVDQWPHQQVAHEMYGHQFMVPIPDIDRTDLFVIMGANPVASNGSLMTAPGVSRRLKAIMKRGGEVIVIDPRKTETADLATTYLSIRPGTDVYLMAAVLRLILENGWHQPGPWTEFSTGLDELKSFVQSIDVKDVSRLTSIPQDEIECLAQTFAKAEKACWYGRIGVSTQRFGATTQWLIQCVNIITNKLDTPGGLMFPSPAVNVLDFLSPGHHGRWKSRVRSLPEFAGELPVIALTEEIETAGDGQIKGLVLAAGNPAVTTPNGQRLERAIQGLEFMVAIDFYLNETNRHAHIILPPVSPLERDHYDLIFHQFAIRNTSKFSQATMPRPVGAMDDGEIFAELTCRLARHKKLSFGQKFKFHLQKRMGARRILAFALKKGQSGVSLKQLLQNPHGIDLGAMAAQLPKGLRQEQIQLAPKRFVEDLNRVKDVGKQTEEFRLIGRRHLLNNNSWLRHIPHLNRGKSRMTLLISPKDAESLGVSDGDLVTVKSDVAQIDVVAELDSGMTHRVVCLPYGFSGRAHAHTASPFPHSASINDITHSNDWDRVSGNAVLSGVRVEVGLADAQTATKS